MADFCTIADIEDFLQLEIDEADKVASAQRAITEATAAIKNYCRQYLEVVEDDEITLDCRGGTKLNLPELPVVEVSEVVEDGETLTVDDDYKLGQHGILHRIGAKWKAGVQIVEVTYTHGYDVDDDELPEIIRDIATRAASRAYQAGLRSAEVDGVPGVASLSIGDYSVTFSGEMGGGAGEGIMGASASRMLLLSEKDALDRAFRITY